MALECCHSHRKICHFQLIDPFSYCSQSALLPDNKLADSLLEQHWTGAPFPFANGPIPVAFVVAKIRHTRYATWRRNLPHNSLLF